MSFSFFTRACRSTHVSEVLQRAKKDHVRRTYGIHDWEDTEDFLSKLAFKQGRLMKGGEPDIETVARVVLFDWQKGKLPYFVAPPFDAEAGPAKEIVVENVKLVLDPQKFSELEVDEAMAQEREKDYRAMRIQQSLDLPDDNYVEFGTSTGRCVRCNCG